MKAVKNVTGPWISISFGHRKPLSFESSKNEPNGKPPHLSNTLQTGKTSRRLSFSEINMIIPKAKQK